MSEIAPLLWPLTRLDEAIETLSRHASLRTREVDIAIPHSFKRENETKLTFEDVDQWIEWACNEFAIEVEPLETPIPDLDDLLRKAGPVVIRYIHDGRFHVLLLLRVSVDSAFLVAPDGQLVKHSLVALRSLLAGPVEQDAIVEMEGLLSKVPENSKPRIQRKLLEELTSSALITGFWMLRTPPVGRFLPQLWGEKLHEKLLIVVTLSIALYVAEILSWSLIGKGALGGQLSFGWLLAWVLLLLTTMTLGLFVQWVQGLFSIGLGSLLKHRLLAGALRMKSDALRSQGVGQLLGRVIESQSFDSLVLGSGLGLIVGVIELTVAAWVLSIGVGGRLHIMLLLFWLVCTALAILVFYNRQRNWTRMRLNLTHDLVEKMTGHRTRLVQELPTDRHLYEDQQLERYLAESKHFDQSTIPLVAGIGRGWLVLGLLGIVPAFLDTSTSTAGMAISVGGVMLAYRAFSGLVDVGASLVQAAVAWEQIGDLFKASGEPVERGLPLPEGNSTSCRTESMALDESALGADCGGKHKQVLMQARDVSFTYPNQSKPVLDECSLTIHKGDNILLEGPSGGGKSTLAALLVGLRQPDSGLLLLNGLDRTSWGSSWRQQSTSAPQFHENHIITGTLAFNLLMGKSWPASNTDMAEAHILCLQLGLGSLLDRMPSGILQMVGESGWQLSHGERSRVFLARALLQNADLVVLDESFAALDPETLTQCLKCALSKSSSLLVIAHP